MNNSVMLQHFFQVLHHPCTLSTRYTIDKLILAKLALNGFTFINWWFEANAVAVKPLPTPITSNPVICVGYSISPHPRTFLTGVHLFSCSQNKFYIIVTCCSFITSEIVSCMYIHFAIMILVADLDFDLVFTGMTLIL